MKTLARWYLESSLSGGRQGVGNAEKGDGSIVQLRLNAHPAHSTKLSLYFDELARDKVRKDEEEEEEATRA